MSSGSRSFSSGPYCDFSDAVVEFCLPGVGVSRLVEVVRLVGEGIHVLAEEEVAQLNTPLFVEVHDWLHCVVKKWHWNVKNGKKRGSCEESLTDDGDGQKNTDFFSNKFCQTLMLRKFHQATIWHRTDRHQAVPILDLSYREPNESE